MPVPWPTMTSKHAIDRPTDWHGRIGPVHTRRAVRLLGLQPVTCLRSNKLREVRKALDLARLRAAQDVVAALSEE